MRGASELGADQVDEEAEEVSKMEEKILTNDEVAKRLKNIENKQTWHYEHFDDEIKRVEGKKAVSFMRRLYAWSLGLSIIALGIGSSLALLIIAVREGASWTPYQIWFASIATCLSLALVFPMGGYVLLVLMNGEL